MGECTAILLGRADVLYVSLHAALAGQRRVGRDELRHHATGDEPQVRAQRPAGHGGQARRVRGEPLGHRRVQQHRRHWL